LFQRSGGILFLTSADDRNHAQEQTQGTQSNNNQTNRDATGGAVQIRVAYTLPLIIKTTFSGQGGYAPKSLSFGDLEQYTELRLQVDAEVIDGGLFYLGYRMIDMEFENNGGSYEFNNAPYLGIKFVF